MGMMVTGIVLTSIGGLGMLTGASILSVDAAVQGGRFGIVSGVVGLPAIIGGALFAAPGIPLWIVGAKMVPSAPSASSGWARPVIAVGPGSGTLTWTF